ncbi:putative disease resistance protein At1g50180 [Pistacia vera]|uniref:putative disease resistance protein At1g50180 n=1 Tax=Pistacia vera TaxID=55513 RepID=UPI001263C733|nr:putative disease resistance protein At1g50180 [Pistacia vera]
MEFLVEPVISELFNGLIKILGSNEVRDFARQLFGGVDSDLKNLENKLRKMGNLLRNTEDKQLTDESVKEWLENNQDLAYDTEDILDEFAYEAVRRKQGRTLAEQLQGIELPPSPKFNVRMGSEIKDITSRLEQLRLERSDERGLQELSEGSSSNAAVLLRPKESSSVPPKKVVYGGDKDEAKLLDMVIRSDQPLMLTFE